MAKNKKYAEELSKNLQEGVKIFKDIIKNKGWGYIHEN